MKPLACDHCGKPISFTDFRCGHCGHQLGYLPEQGALVCVVEDGGLWSSAAFPDDAYVFCENAHHGTCNWLIRADPTGDIYCPSCRQKINSRPN
ncbi:zinc-ribbon domain protein [compost metagenome]